ncbi:hypothetical protein [Elioraea sp.]|uniref:hypothetical protein n=1 Tax=Elioraea sp. TaxID=2185103 RepID=UPI0025C4E8C0|nr:hypothetical protein [Elioraea sp.]
MSDTRGNDPAYGLPEGAVVDEAALRALRAAQRPGLPDAAIAAPVVVGFAASGRVAVAGVGNLLPDPSPTSQDSASVAELPDGEAALRGSLPDGPSLAVPIAATPDTPPPSRAAPLVLLPSLSPAVPGGSLLPIAPAAATAGPLPEGAAARIDGVAEDPRPARAPADTNAEVTAPGPIADAPRLAVENATTREDVSVAIRISAALDDRDGLGGEVLTITIAGLPPGASLSAGTVLADGSWRLAPADLDGLVLHPGENWSGEATLVVEAASRVPDGNTVVTREELRLTVDAVADAPAVTGTGGAGGEDTAIALDLTVALTDRDGSETITALIIRGVPDGAVLSAGTLLTDGTWSLAPGDLPGLTLTPRAHVSGTLSLELVATSEEADGGAAQTMHPFTVEVTAVADAPTASAADAAGQEDGWIALGGLAASLVDLDGSETLSVAITGLPAGAVLSHGSADGGVWRVPAADLGALSLQPPPDFAGEIALVLEATGTEVSNGDVETTRVPFTVTVAPVVDGAAITAQASGAEDTAIPLSVSFAALTDASEAWAETVLIAGVPADASLNLGDSLGGGVWRVPTAALAAGNVSLTPPANSDADIALTVTATVIDTAGTAEARQDVVVALTLGVDAVADVPVASVADAAGTEDRWIALGGLAASLVDADGSETLAVTLSGVPTGATLSAGTSLGGGVWSVPVGALATLSLRPPEHFSGEIVLALRAVATEAAGGSAEALRSFTVTVAPEVDQGSITVTGQGAEDGWIIIAASFASPDQDGSESWAPTTTIRGVPAGAVLSEGAEISPGVWEVSTASLGASAVMIRPPANSDADIHLTFETVQSDTANGTTVSRVIDGAGTIIVTAVADAPTVTVANHAGVEDQPIPLTGLGGALADTDGSETLSFRLSGLPAGGTLTVGQQNVDGSWTLTPAQLTTVAFVPPPNHSGTYTLTLTAIAAENEAGVLPASASATFQVSVDPVADIGTIPMSAAGAEDSWITIKPNFVTPDTDGSETWSVTTTVSGVPAGAVLSQGTETVPGTWEVSTWELYAGRVKLLPNANSDADFTLTFQALLTDSGNGATDTRLVTGTGVVTVSAMADAAAITVADAAGLEDQWIPLTGLSAALVDTDGSETLTVKIFGVPAGATLSHGTAHGTFWTVPAGDLGTLAILPPRDFSGDLALTLRAYTAEARDGSTATVEAVFTVSVAGVADTPTVRVSPAIGGEDHAIRLALDATARDRDGSESITAFRVGDVPPGAVLATSSGALVAEADGSFLVPAAQAASLTITPPRDWHGWMTLQVSSIAAEPNGSTAESAPVALPVAVVAIADAPVAVTGGAAVAEDAPVPLGIAAALSDADGSEVLSYLVSGVPEGMSLTVGTYAGPGRWSLTAADAATAALIVPGDYAGTLSLTLTAVAQETGGGSIATTTVPLPVVIGAEIDTPSVGGLGGGVARWATASGPEDGAIALALDPGLSDRDGSEAVTGTITISGVPAGAMLRYADGTVLTPEGGAYAVPAARIDDVRIVPPPNSDVAFDLSVTMTISDTGGVSETISGLLTVDPRGVADAATINASDVTGSTHQSTSAGDGWIPLSLSATTPDTDGSEAIRLVLHDVPDGFVLSAGRNMGNGTWVLAPGDEDGLSIRPPAGFEGTLALEVEAVVTEREGDVSRSLSTFDLTVAPPSTDGGGSSGGDGDGSGGGSGSGGDGSGDGGTGDGGTGDGGTGTGGGGGGGATPDALAAPTLSAVLASGDEDAPLALAITVGHAGGGTGAVALTVVVSGLPDGATLSAGFLDSRSGEWILSQGELAGLTVNPPADHSGPISVTLRAVATDTIGATASTAQPVAATIEAVADAPTVTAAPASGVEDQAVALNIAVATADVDGSEIITSVQISDVPAGAALDGPGITDNGDGTYSIDPASIGALRLIPPANAHGDFAVTVTVRSVEASNGDARDTVVSVPFTVAADADAPILSAGVATGTEDQAIPLSITAALADTDGSEMLSIVISGLPAAAFLSAGVNNGDGSWTLLPDELAGLTLTPPLNYSGTIAATVTAYAVERGTGDVAVTSVALPIVVSDGVDTPIIVARTTLRGDEDTAIAVNVSAALRDTDGSETLTVIASGVPAGARFSAGTEQPDGTWIFTAAELPGLTFTPPAHASGDITIRFTAVATEFDGTTASAQAETVFTVTPVTDAADITVTPAVALEGAAVPLSIAVALVDADGSEEIVGVVISGLPPGATLTAGTVQPDGSWLLSAAQLAGLALNPAPGWSGQVNLTVSAETRELETDARVTTTIVPVTVDAVATAPVVTANAASGVEDGAIPLTISAALVDTDGSETLTTVTISGLPPGASLTAGTVQGNGSWVLTPAQLSGLALIPAANWSGTATLSISATARETANGDEATTTITRTLTVTGVADAPSLSVVDAAGTEGTTIPLTLAASLTDTDGSEVLSVTIAGVPSGFTLSAGSDLGGGRWSVPPAALATLALAAPTGWVGTFSLAITARAQEGASSAETVRSLTVTIDDVAHAPVLTLGAAEPVSTTETQADIVGSASITELDGEAITAASVRITTGQAAGDRITIDGYVLTADGGDLLIGATGIRIVGGAFDAATGTLSLSGAASADTYAAVIESLQLVDQGGGVLSPGVRSLDISLTDAAGDTTRESLSVLVAENLITGDGTAGTLQGTGQDDVFIGTDASETMRGLSGNDFFLIDAGGGNDIVQAGAGFDTLMLGGVVGAPVAGPATGQAWTLVIDTPGVSTVAGDGTLDFSAPASGRIVFGEGGQVEFSELERITW